MDGGDFGAASACLTVDARDAVRVSSLEGLGVVGFDLPFDTFGLNASPGRGVGGIAVYEDVDDARERGVPKSSEDDLLESGNAFDRYGGGGDAGIWDCRCRRLSDSVIC